MGSSQDRMWTALVRLTMSSSEASVVDLPEPVGPVTSTMPRGRSASVFTTGGRPRVSKSGILKGMTRSTAPTAPRWRKTFMRKRLADLRV